MKIKKLKETQNNGDNQSAHSYNYCGNTLCTFSLFYQNITKIVFVYEPLYAIGLLG